MGELIDYKGILPGRKSISNLANGESYNILIPNNSTIFIMYESNAYNGIFKIICNRKNVRSIINDETFSTIKDTSGKINIYFSDTDANVICIQNKLGADRNIYYSVI